MARYIFLNRELGHAGKNRRMQGFHGTNYGPPSCWSVEHQAQAVELDLTPKEYLAVVFDLARCWHLALRKWIPVPMESVPSRVPEVIEFEAGFNLAMDGQPLPDGASLAAKAGHEIVVWNMATETHKEAKGDEAPRHERSPVDPTIPTRVEIPVDGGVISMPLNRGYTKPVSAADQQPPVPYEIAWFKAVSLAKAEGLNPEDFQGDGRKRALIDAINSKRAGKQLAPA